MEADNQLQIRKLKFLFQEAVMSDTKLSSRGNNHLGSFYLLVYIMLGKFREKFELIKISEESSYFLTINNIHKFPKKWFKNLICDNQV
jgi:hypothetical protein